MCCNLARRNRMLPSTPTPSLQCQLAGNCLQRLRNNFLQFWTLRFLRISKCVTNLHGLDCCNCSKNKHLSDLRLFSSWYPGDLELYSYCAIKSWLVNVWILNKWPIAQIVCSERKEKAKILEVNGYSSITGFRDFFIGRDEKVLMLFLA